MFLLEQLPVQYLNNIFQKSPSFFYKVYYLNKLIPFSFFKITITASNLVINIFHEYLYVIFFSLKKHSLFRYQQLTDISCIDLLTTSKRFSLYYYLLSFLNTDRLAINLDLHEMAAPYSLTPLYKGANWYEREVWDMFGIFFQKNKDMRRILTDYGFSGHPLRKDFPLSGFVELFYDDSKKKLIYNKIALAQEYRFFSFSNPWKLSK